MAFYEGAKFRFKAEGKEIFHEGSVDISGSKEVKETASKDTGDYPEATGGKKTVTGSVNGYLSKDTPGAEQIGMETILGYWDDDTVVAATIASEDVGTILLSQNVIITDWQITSENEETVSFSYSFRGTGTLSIGSVSA